MINLDSLGDIAMAIRLVVLILVGLVVVGCATTGDLQTMQSDLNEARRIAFENRNKVRELSDQLAISETTAQVQEPAPQEAVVADTDLLTNLRKSQAELGLRLEDLSREIRVLQGRLDEIQYGTERSLGELKDQKDLLMIRISALEERIRIMGTTGVSPSAPAATPTPATPTAPVGLAPPTAPLGTLPGSPDTTMDVPVGPDATASPDSPIALYKRAHELYKSKEFAKAREMFQKFLTTYPTHEYAGHAQFWTGETYFSEENYENAILAYEDVLRKYKQSEKVPAAMLKQGYAFSALGDDKTAKIILDRVQKKYAGTHEAELATRKLEALNKGR